MIHALRYTEDLEKVGFSTEQARASVQIWMDLMDQNFATKSDFKEHYFMTRNDLMNLQIMFKNHFDEIDKRFVDIDRRFIEIDKRFTEIDKRFTEVDKRFTEIEAKFEKLESNLIIKLGIMMAASIGIISAIINLK